MINYLLSFAFTDLAIFPNTKSVNASGPTASDGTEFVKLMIDDIWGRNQALLSHAGLTPDGITEAPGTSQHIEALQKGFAHPGEGVTWWLKDDPATVGARVLLLNGQGILRSSYSDLDLAVYVGDGDNPTASAFFHADDAAGTSRNIAGLYLILPETRGYGLRGLDLAASVDPDGASRDMGSSQLDSFQNHSFGTLAANRLGNRSDLLNGGSSQALIGNAASTPGTVIATDAGLGEGIPRVSSESRMVNIATKFGIRY